MKTRILAAPLLALLLGACTADNNASVQWQSICALPDDASKCSFESTCGAQYIGEYYLDVAVAPNLWLFMQLNNNRANTANPDYGAANTADAYVQEYVVSYSSGLAIPSSAHPVQYTVPAEGNAVVSVFAFDDPARSALTTAIPAGGFLTVTASIVARGIYADQSEFETAAFEVPVFVCNGCFGALTCTDPTQSVIGTCPPTPGNAGGQLPLAAACQ